MSACEKCWRDAGIEAWTSQGDKVDIYRRLVQERDCTPEEQAGPDAGQCEKCKRMTAHQHTGECMACGHDARLQAHVDVENVLASMGDV